MKQLIVGSALMTASYLVYYLLCSLVACLLASYLLISVNKPHSLWSALLTASYLLSVLSTKFIPYTKLSDNLICILPCGLQIWLVGKIQTNQHLESAYYQPQSANLHFTRARVAPSGRLPSVRRRPDGSFMLGTSALCSERQMISFMA